MEHRRQYATYLVLFTLLAAVMGGCTVVFQFGGTYYRDEAVKSLSDAQDDPGSTLESIHSGDFFDDDNDNER